MGGAGNASAEVRNLAGNGGLAVTAFGVRNVDGIMLGPGYSVGFDNNRGRWHLARYTKVEVLLVFLYHDGNGEIRLMWEL
jgi:hypothetical protein